MNKINISWAKVVTKAYELMYKELLQIGMEKIENLIEN